MNFGRVRSYHSNYNPRAVCSINAGLHAWKGNYSAGVWGVGVWVGVLVVT